MTRTTDTVTAPAPATQARAALDHAGFLLLCLWTRRSPAAARQDLAGWDAGFGPA